MSQLWILEKAKDWNAGLATLLMGDFAVRRFKSVASLRFGLMTEEAPQGLVLCENLSGEDEVLLKDVLSLQTVVLSRFGNLDGLEIDETADVLELVKTIRMALHLQREKRQDEVYHFQGLVFSPSQKKIWASDNQKLSEYLSEKEGQILKFLLEAASKTLSIEKIKQLVWKQAKVSRSSLESHISRLRKKMRQCSDLNLLYRAKEQVYTLTQLNE